MQISNRVRGIKPSFVFELNERAQKLGAVNFTAGEPDFATPDYVIDAAKKALDNGKTKYTATGGILPLREAVCRKLKKDNGLDYSPEQIVVSNGCKQCLYNTLSALVDPGDEVILFAPFWITYPEMVRLCGGVPVTVDFDAEKLRRAITPKTKVIMLNSPNNPSGAVYSEKVLKKIAAVIEETDIYVISDEIYEKLIYDGTKHYSIASYSPKLYSQTVVINGLSKAYAMTGWRVGYTASSPETARAIKSFQSHITQNINTPAQYAALEALTNEKGEDTIRSMTAAFKERGEYMVKRLGNMPYISCTKPQGAFYVMADVRKLGASGDVSETLLEQANIAVVPCDAFGAPGFVRLTYALSMDEIKKGLDNLEKYLRSI